MLDEKLFEESNLRIGYIICFVTAVGFICSLTYNCGYFWLFTAGTNILSIGDILTSYTLWIPGFGTLLFCYGLELFLRHIEDRKHLLRFKKHQKIFQKLFTIPHIFLLTLALILLISFILFGFTFRPLIIWLSFFYIVLSVYGYLANTKFFSGRQNKLILGIFFFVLIVLSLMFTLGMDKAREITKLNSPNANLFFIFEKQTAYPVILLRHLEKGLLVKEIDNNNYIFFTWDDLSRIEILAHKTHFAGILH